jgi:translation initiation factor IF-2
MRLPGGLRLPWGSHVPPALGLFAAASGPAGAARARPLSHPQYCLRLTSPPATPPPPCPPRSCLTARTAAPSTPSAGSCCPPSSERPWRAPGPAAAAPGTPAAGPGPTGELFDWAPAGAGGPPPPRPRAARHDPANAPAYRQTPGARATRGRALTHTHGRAPPAVARPRRMRPRRPRRPPVPQRTEPLDRTASEPPTQVTAPFLLSFQDRAEGRPAYGRGAASVLLPRGVQCGLGRRGGWARPTQQGASQGWSQLWAAPPAVGAAPPAGAMRRGGRRGAFQAGGGGKGGVGAAREAEDGGAQAALLGWRGNAWRGAGGWMGGGQQEGGKGGHQAWHLRGPAAATAAGGVRSVGG